MIRAAIIGASGYTGGELLRLLLDHPQAEVVTATSRRHAGTYVHQIHPNLRRRSSLKFSAAERLESVDVLFLALPHGEAQLQIEALTRLAPRVIDLSADFRLRSPEAYARWYGTDHAAPAFFLRVVFRLSPPPRRAGPDGSPLV